MKRVLLVTTILFSMIATARAADSMRHFSESGPLFLDFEDGEALRHEIVGQFKFTLDVDTSKTLNNGTAPGTVIGQGEIAVTNSKNETLTRSLTCVLQADHWVECAYENPQTETEIWVGSNINFMEFYRLEVFNLNGFSGYTADLFDKSEH